jgi:PAS domain S-box-containing protein
MNLTSRWWDLPMRTKGHLVVALPAAATIMIACGWCMLASRAAEAGRVVQHSMEVSSEIERLKLHAVESSTQVRGYYLTRDEGFLLLVRASMASFDIALEQLADLIGNNRGEARLLAEVAAVERSRMARVIRDTTMFQGGTLKWSEIPPALKAADSERANIDGLLNSIKKEEERLMEGRLRRVDELRAGLRGIAVICGLLGVIGGVMISILFASGITNRIGKLRGKVARMTAGGILDPLPAGRDEIGELSAELYQAADFLRRRNAAFENCPHGIAQVNAAGRYVEFNRVFGQLTGFTDALSAPSVLETTHPEDRGRVSEAIARMRGSEQLEIEMRAVHPGGGFGNLGATFAPVSENPADGYFVFLRDLRRQKEAETEMTQARNAAVAASLAKSSFLAKISHDIRTPLNAILGATDLLAQTPLTADQAEYVSMFQRNSRRLVALINDFLDFSKIESGAVRVENIAYRIRETVAEALAPFREVAYQKGVRLEAEVGKDVPEWELGDPLRVHQVLVNLVSNAIKFTRQGRVTVTVLRIAVVAGEEVRFEISDTGPGIAPADQQRIFAAFAQAGKPDPREGCGLGLAICRELVERMGGEIGVTSREGTHAEGCGSTFHFVLPLVAARPVDDRAKTSVPSRLVPRRRRQDAVRVLVAEDTEDNRRLLAHYVRGEPIDLRFAENGEAAVALIRRGEEFDLILMDLDMPVLDGFSAVKAIRAWQTARGVAPTPIVALSADAMHEAVRKCLDAGCAAHAAKPIDQATLLGTIRRYAGRDRVPGKSAAVSAQITALVPRYLASKPSQIEEARASLAAKDFELISRFGHNLKGTGGGYGFPRIEEIGIRLEKAAAERDERNISEQLEALSLFLAEKSPDYRSERL